MNLEVIVSNIKEKKVTKPKYTGRDNYYFDESGDYVHHRTECDVCDRSVFKRTLVHGLCEMCDEKVINKKLNYLHSKNKDKHKTEAELK
jgi:polyphosphate kinase 2 (PPK2 family)